MLSGGERNRLNLAMTLKQGGNLILLDEPTNDLDVETLGSLENALAGVPRLRRRDLARPLVPRPDLHAHPRVGRWLRRQRGRLVLVRGQLRGLRGEQGRSGSAPTRPVRTASRTASSPGTDPVSATSLVYSCEIQVRWGDSDRLGHVNNTQLRRVRAGSAHRLPARRAASVAADRERLVVRKMDASSSSRPVTDTSGPVRVDVSVVSSRRDLLVHGAARHP